MGEKPLEFDFMKDMHEKDDAIMDEIAESAYGTFLELMDKYSVSEEDREEIVSLCKWF